ncbi:MAG: hypothetical protein GY934_09665, partial [Gammaproteobacteria bacterium]|nr:hypothetical protein [Gammaproteobacteria bacterium]
MNRHFTAPTMVRRKTIWWGYSPVIVVMLLGIIVTFNAYNEVSSWESQRNQIIFRDASQARILVVQREIDHTLGMIQDVASFIEASPVVGRREFRKYVAPAIKRHAGIKALAWVPRVAGEGRKRFIANARRSFRPFQILEKGNEGTVIPARDRSEYFPFLYVQPYSLNRELLGLDQGVSQEVFPLISRSEDTRQLQVSRRIQVIGGDGAHSGFMVSVPVFHKTEMELDSDPETTDDPPPQALRGFALGIFRIGDMVERALEGLSPGGISIRYYESRHTQGEELLYTHASRVQPGDLDVEEPNGENNGFTFVQTLKLGDRLWKVVCAPIQGRYEAESSSGWIVLVGGFSFTILLTIYLLTLVRHAKNVNRLVDERTTQLRSAIGRLRMEIIERQNAKTELQSLNEELERRVAIRTSEAERRSKDLEQFAYVTSHDLKAPLRGIANLSQWISDDLQDVLNDETSEQLQLLQDRVSRMHSLIEGLLEYARVGRTEVSYTLVDSGQLLEEVVDSLSPQENFSVEIGSGMPVFKTDRLQLG